MLLHAQVHCIQHNFLPYTRVNAPLDIKVNNVLQTKFALHSKLKMVPQFIIWNKEWNNGFFFFLPYGSLHHLNTAIQHCERTSHSWIINCLSLRHHTLIYLSLTLTPSPFYSSSREPFVVLTITVHHENPLTPSTLQFIIQTHPTYWCYFVYIRICKFKKKSA